MPDVFIREDEDPDYDVFLTSNSLLIYLDLRGKEVAYDKVYIRTDGSKIYVLDSRNNNLLKIIILPVKINPSSLMYNYKNGIFILKCNKSN